MLLLMVCRMHVYGKAAKEKNELAMSSGEQLAVTQSFKSRADIRLGVKTKWWSINISVCMYVHARVDFM